MNETTKAWEKEERTVTLTNEEWSNLTCYILMTTNHRTGELETWRSLAQEKDEDGNTKFKNAVSNAKFWEEMIRNLDRIRSEIDGSH